MGRETAQGGGHARCTPTAVLSPCSVRRRAPPANP